jgi:hypothetical protein
MAPFWIIGCAQPESAASETAAPRASCLANPADSLAAARGAWLANPADSLAALHDPILVSRSWQMTWRDPGTDPKLAGRALG